MIDDTSQLTSWPPPNKTLILRVTNLPDEAHLAWIEALSDRVGRLLAAFTKTPTVTMTLDDATWSIYDPSPPS